MHQIAAPTPSRSSQVLVLGGHPRQLSSAGRSAYWAAAPAPVALLSSASGMVRGSFSRGDERRERNVSVVPFEQGSVRCVGILVCEENSATRDEAQCDRHTEKDEHYRKLLPAPDVQIRLVARRRVLKMQLSVAPHDVRCIRAWSEIQLDVYQQFSAYLDHEVNRFANHETLQFDRQHNHAELKSTALEVFSKTLDDCAPEGGEVSRLLAQRLKYALLHKSQRLASQKGSAAGSLYMPDKAFREVRTYRAAKDAGTLDELVARRNWSDRKVQSLQAGEHMLDPICRLDGPVTSRDSKANTMDNLHDSIGDRSTVCQTKSLASREVLDVLNDLVVKSLRPIHRLIITASFGMRAISMKEAARRITHFTTGENIRCGHLHEPPTIDELPELLGMSAETIRRIRVEGLQRLHAALRREGIDVTALQDLSATGESIIA